jgi:hypothetical protein
MANMIYNSIYFSREERARMIESGPAHIAGYGP